jgi:hypothetical protein
MATLVAQYDAEISSVAGKDGAIVVDVNAVLTRALRNTGPASPFAQLFTTGRRGRGPSAETALSSAGSALVAKAFEERVPPGFTKTR